VKSVMLRPVTRTKYIFKTTSSYWSGRMIS